MSVRWLVVWATLLTASSCGKPDCEELKQLCAGCEITDLKTACQVSLATSSAPITGGNDKCRAILDAKTYRLCEQ